MDRWSQRLSQPISHRYETTGTTVGAVKISGEREREREREMGAVTAALIAIAAVALGWCTIEIACKPCLEKGREAIDRNLNPDYDPDDHPTTTSTLNAPLNPNKDGDGSASASSTVVKIV